MNANRSLIATTALMAFALTPWHLAAAEAPVRLITLDPGHFHAALVQKSMYPGVVDPLVHVYAPGGPELEGHRQRIYGFNTRATNPTAWKEAGYTGPDFFEKMLQDKPGNVVVISGNNRLKSKYILACIQAGLNVLSDKPMAITPADLPLIKEAMAEAERRKLLLRDIMPERYEITTILQHELSRRAAVFGELLPGTPDAPSVIVENVHHYFKQVDGKPLIRPAWFFDAKQQGEGIVDVSTHLVDLAQMKAFPEVPLSPADVTMLSARRWVTKVDSGQFARATGRDVYPDYLKPYADSDNVLNVYGNGSFTYALRGVHTRISVEWRFESTNGAGDSHYSVMRGSKADLIIRQGAEEKYKPTLYIEKRDSVSDEAFERTLKAAVADLAVSWPGVELTRKTQQWVVTIPELYKTGHEAHFSKVMANYLKALKEGKSPAWEMPNLLTKYHTIMQAYEMSR